MRLNKLQIQAIKNKAGYKSTDYCNVSADDVKQFLLEQHSELGNKKKKETLLQIIWDDEELTQLFGERFFNDFYCNIYDLVNGYHISWEEAQGLIEGGLVEGTGDLSKKGYPLLSLNALKFTRDEIRALYQSHFEGNIVKIRLEVDDKEQGSSITQKLSQLFDLGELNYHPRRDDNRLHLYTTLFPKDSVSESYEVSENARLKNELAEMQLKLQEANKQLTDALGVINGKSWGVEDTEQYKSLKNKYDRAYKELIDIRTENNVLKMKSEHIERELEKIKEKRSRAGRKRECSNETIKKVFELKEQGLSIRKIAAEVGVGSTLVHRILTDESYSKDVQTHT